MNMNIVIERLNPDVPDPVESRRRAAGRLVRTTYAAAVFGVLAFFVIYFGAPLVFLSGPGTVASSRQVISLPYVVQVINMTVKQGAIVKAGDQLGQVRSPEHESLVATYMRSIADIAGRRAELRIKGRVAQETLEAARNYLRLTEETMSRIKQSDYASLNFQIEILRQRALAQKAVVSQEAEIAESITQLSDLDEISQQLRTRVEEAEHAFADGRIFAPIDGIVSVNPARTGQSLTAGTPIAEILDPKDVYVIWYIPNERLVEPRNGENVMVLFGNRRIPGTIVDILPVSSVHDQQPLLAGARASSQIARVRFDRGEDPPALNASVKVHMFYTDVAAYVAAAFANVLSPR